jgi:hypothetical protein
MNWGVVKPLDMDFRRRVRTDDPVSNRSIGIPSNGPFLIELKNLGSNEFLVQ